MDDHVDAFRKQRQIGQERVAHLLGVVAVDEAAGLAGLPQHLPVFKPRVERQLAVQECRGHGKQAVSDESCRLPPGVGVNVPAVSYTHLDVYKRQSFHCAKVAWFIFKTVPLIKLR